MNLVLIVSLVPVHTKTWGGDFLSKASVYFTLEHPGDKRSCKEIKRRLDLIPGVISVSVSNDRGRVAVDYDTTGTHPDQLRSALTECGCSAKNVQIHQHTM